MTLRVTLNGSLIAVSKERWQKVGGMIPDFGIAIRAPDKIRARESVDEASTLSENYRPMRYTTGMHSLDKTCM